MSVIINSRALYVEQELKTLYACLENYGESIKHSYLLSGSEMDVLISNIRKTNYEIEIARTDLSAMLAEARPMKRANKRLQSDASPQAVVKVEGN